MNQQVRAIIAEFVKNRHHPIRWVSFIAFILAPIFGGLFMFLMKGDGYEGLSGALRTKAALMSFEANWDSYLGLLSQAVGVGGILIFGFVASWLFGREHSDETAKDLMALPISRTKILNAKFLYYTIWCFTLVSSNLLFGLLIGFALQLEGWDSSIFGANLRTYLITTILVLFANLPIAFLALWGAGYLVPLAGVILLIVLAQMIAAMGLGTYFPWAIPGIYSGSGGEELRSSLDILSFVILGSVALVGYLATIYWWNHADQK